MIFLFICRDKDEGNKIWRGDESQKQRKKREPGKPSWMEAMLWQFDIVIWILPFRIEQKEWSGERYA